MDLGVIVALASLLLSGVIIAAVIGGAWALGRQHEQKLLRRDVGPGSTSARLDRIEFMLHTLSTDLERLAENPRLSLPRND